MADFSRLIDFYNDNQKSLFTAFVINLPIVYSFLYLFTESFRGLDIIQQIVFSFTADIISMFCIFLMSIYRDIKLKKSKSKVNVLIYILPQCLTGLIYFPLLPIIPNGDISIYIPTSFFISLLLFVCVVARRTAKNLKNDIKSERAEDNKD